MGENNSSIDEFRLHEFGTNPDYKYRLFLVQFTEKLKSTIGVPPRLFQYIVLRMLLANLSMVLKIRISRMKLY
uniref:Uncharacterized protein n=1 Tax=Ditylenchus dipsaci TaxID=166011 RepID=A0A915DBF9_9BILA